MREEGGGKEEMRQNMREEGGGREEMRQNGREEVRMNKSKEGREKGWKKRWEEGGRGEERRDEKGGEWRERKEDQERGKRQYIREVESKECKRIVKVHTYKDGGECAGWLRVNTKNSTFIAFSLCEHTTHQESGSSVAHKAPLR